MRYSISGAILALISISAGLAQASPAEDVANYVRTYEKNIQRRSEIRPSRFSGRSESTQTCTEANTRVRKSWAALTTQERLNYIDAIKCMRELPALTPTSVAPGARHRIDDFAVNHIDQTLFVHVSGWFLSWHRGFIWQFETALRDECGYTGAQPYWDWTENSHDFADHPMFDGSATSFGGNGVFVAHEAVNDTLPGIPMDFYCPRAVGTGFGCVVDGAFPNQILNLGPKFPYGDRDSSGLEYTPHCLTRNFNQELAQAFLNDEKVSAVLSQPTLADFRHTLDTTVHPVGHDSLGGDVGDIFTSPQDPVFFFHHSQLDRLWAIWQQQDPANRINAVADTITLANSPPSRNALITDNIEFGYVGGSIPMSDLVDPLGGHLCFRYE